MTTPKPVILIGGPTAVGKTKCAIDLALKFGGEIVSADSMQIYKFMDIGSAKPTPEERAQVPHHMIDIVDPREDFSVSDYKKLAEATIDDIHNRGLIPIVVGGTGLYMNSLLYNMDFAKEQGDDAYRLELQAFLDTNGIEAFYERLKTLDPEAAERIHPNNTRRVMRAIEIAELSGEKIGNFKTDLEHNHKYQFYFIGLTDERKKLYDRINQRVIDMISDGLLNELDLLKNMGLDVSFTSMKGIGYKEFFPYLNGEKTLETVIEEVQQNSRRYAKRQLTWFRRYDQLHWYSLDDFSSWEVLTESIEKNIRDYFKF